MKRNRVNGFTLIELLTVFGIIAVIAAILMPVVARSLGSGYRTNDINNLRQLGIAQNIYIQDEGAMTFDASVLAKVGLVNKQVLRSRFDPYPSGLASIVVTRQTAHGRNDSNLDPVMPLSYIDPGIFNWGPSFYSNEISSQAEAGWLVDPFFDGNQPEEVILNRYLRLENDGSVRNKVAFTYGDCGPNLETYHCAYPAVAYFADGDAEWAKQWSPSGNGW